MPKTLLSVVNLNGSICSTEIDCSDEKEYQRLGASILSMMDKDENFAKQILGATAVYVLKRKELSEVNKASMRAAEIKTKN